MPATVHRRILGSARIAVVVSDTDSKDEISSATLGVSEREENYPSSALSFLSLLVAIRGLVHFCHLCRTDAALCLPGCQSHWLSRPPRQHVHVCPSRVPCTTCDPAGTTPLSAGGVPFWGFLLLRQKPQAIVTLWVASQLATMAACFPEW